MLLFGIPEVQDDTHCMTRVSRHKLLNALTHTCIYGSNELCFGKDLAIFLFAYTSKNGGRDSGQNTLISSLWKSWRCLALGGAFRQRIFCKKRQAWIKNVAIFLFRNIKQ